MRIKPIRSTVEPTVAPGVRAPLGIGAGFAQGLGQMGAALGETGRVLLAIEARKKYFDDSVSLTDLTSKYKMVLEGYLQDLNVTAYKDLPEKRKRIEVIRQQSFDEAADINPQVAANWKRIWSPLHAETEIRASRIDREKLRQNTIAGIISFGNLMENEAVNAKTERNTEELAAIRKNVFAAFDNLRNNFNVPGATTEVWKEQFDRNVAAKFSAAEKEAQRQTEKGLITAAYIGITQEARDPVTKQTDYAKAYDLLKQPATLKRYGLTAEAKKTLTGIFTNEEARDKETTEKIREQERASLLPRIHNGDATDDDIDATTLDAKEKNYWKEKLEARSKAIIAGKKNPLEITEPWMKADLTRMALVDPEELKELGGTKYIWKFVGKGLSIDDAKQITKLYEDRDKTSKDPLQSSGFKNSVKTLDLARKNLMFIEKTLDDDITDEEQLENQYLYGTAHTDLEKRVIDGEDPLEALKTIMDPFIEKKTRSWLGNLVDYMGQFYQAPPYGELLEEGKPKPEIDRGKRERAIKILTDAGKLVNEETIGLVMERLP